MLDYLVKKNHPSLSENEVMMLEIIISINAPV
jgi:hypothetical protein